MSKEMMSSFVLLCFGGLASDVGAVELPGLNLAVVAVAGRHLLAYFVLQTEVDVINVTSAEVAS